MENKTLVKKPTRLENIYNFIALLLHIILLIKILQIKTLKPKTYLQLTSISFYSSFIFFSLSILNPLMNIKLHVMQFICEVAFIFSFIAFSLFWLLFAFKREYLNKEETVLNFYMSFSLHGGNFFLVCWYLIIFEPYSENENNTNLNPLNFSFYAKVIFSICFCLFYLIFGILLFKSFEVAIYPLFKRMTIKKFAIFMILGPFLFLISDMLFTLIAI